MSNTYFQFKQFTVHQQHCAMKVCTDACLFGAWVGEAVSSRQPEVKNILDVGTGTGLLSLLLAQKTNALIDAVEIEEAAAQQAADNFEASPWKNRLQVLQGDIRTIHLGRKYGLIISNPPFFENNLKSPDGKRNLALHSDMLGLDGLVAIAKNNLADDGMFAVLLPYERKNECVQIARSNELYLVAEVAVKQSTQHDYFRTMLLFGTTVIASVASEITIRDGNDYHPDFIRLLKDYYLHL